MGKESSQRTATMDHQADVTEICPNCGKRGEWQKCKLVCLNPHCGVRIILACVD